MTPDPYDPAADARRLRHSIRTLLGCFSLNVELLRLSRPARDDDEALDTIARAVDDIAALLAIPPAP